MIKFDRNICNNFEAASSREWLETNGIGGFASGTISGANTRRYHGLLTAAIRPPLGRITVLSKFEETIEFDGGKFDLSSDQFPGVVSPRGYLSLKEFRLDPFPIWTYEVEGVEIEKRVFMLHGSNTTVCRWRVLNDPQNDVHLVLKPLLSFVDYHALQHESDAALFDHSVEGNVISIVPRGEEPELFLIHSGAEIVDTGYWYKNFEYAIEQERGFDFSEDLFQPFEIAFDLSSPAIVVASTDGGIDCDYEAFESSEIKRRKSLIRKAGAKTDFEKDLVLAADQFVVARGAGHTVIAGYPWFSDWGRDTMIALPGLTLAAGRHDIAREILLEFSGHISQGMLPNRFPDAGDTAEYNTVDATLWYFEAVRAYVEKTGDTKFVRKNLYEKLADIVAWHLHGTRYNIHVDTDGLLFAGSPDVQLTWMDAKIGDLVITPRTGKPVEIQALWYNALLIMAGLAAAFGDNEDEQRYRAMAELCKLSFNGAFWNDADQCLYDVVMNGDRDASIRPNQIFAVSLTHSMLDAERAAKVVAKVEKELLTPVGLRSLAPGDPDYRPIYIGSPFDRDSAYHQGTVWGWLIGPFVDAYRKVYGEGAKTEARVKEILSGFESHLSESGLRQISEIFDADAPHYPRGCFAQAWSVAEVLRVSRPKA
ncbi:MAG: glycogen debranching protein [Acidobacteria bacterium]|nr:glycogen debranching protein [Acidobacteriota bacterium]